MKFSVIWWRKNILLTEREEKIPLTISRLILVIVVNYRCCCGAINLYDGMEDAILHMEGMLVHYSLLRNYMFLFLNGNSMTFHHYFTSWTAELKSIGYEQHLMNYNQFKDSWYAFLSLLDIDYAEGSVCSTCGPQPETVVCDGTSIGFQRKFLVCTNEVSEDVIRKVRSVLYNLWNIFWYFRRGFISWIRPLV